MKATDVGVDPDFMEEYLRTDARSAEKQGKRWRRHYTIVPRAWGLRLLGASGATHQLANELLYQRFRLDQDVYTRDLPVVVSSAVAKAAGVSARSKTRALVELERRGLIRMVRSSRRSPRVILLRTEVLRQQRCAERS
jgi:hypothetical protein